MVQKILEFVSNGSGLLVVMTVAMGGTAIALRRRSSSRFYRRVASIGASALALLGVSECEQVDPTPTPPPPTCYAPVFETPVPVVSPTPKDVPTPSCYDMPAKGLAGTSQMGASVLASRLNERLATLQELAGERLQPDVVRVLLTNIERDVRVLTSEGVLAGLEDEEREDVSRLGEEALAQVQVLRERLTD